MTTGSHLLIFENLFVACASGRFVGGFRRRGARDYCRVAGVILSLLTLQTVDNPAMQRSMYYLN